MLLMNLTGKVESKIWVIRDLRIQEPFALGKIYRMAVFILG